MLRNVKQPSGLSVRYSADTSDVANGCCSRTIHANGLVLEADVLGLQERSYYLGTLMSLYLGETEAWDSITVGAGWVMD